MLPFLSSSSSELYDQPIGKDHKRLSRIGVRTSQSPTMLTGAWLLPPSRLVAFGIGSLRQKNIALLMKWLRRYTQEENKLWRLITEAIYGVDNFGWFSKQPKERSREYGSQPTIIKFGDQFILHTEYVVGNEMRLKFWKDKWCDSQPLASRFPRIYALSSNKVMIADCWCTANQS